MGVSAEPGAKNDDALLVAELLDLVTLPAVDPSVSAALLAGHGRPHSTSPDGQVRAAPRTSLQSSPASLGG